MVVFGGLSGKRLRGRVPLTRHVPLRHRPLFNRPDRPSVGAIEYIKGGLFGRLRYGFDRLAVDRDVGKDRRGRNIHIPDPVVHELVVPLSRTRLQIDRDQRLTKQSVTRPMAAVIVAGRRLDRQVHEPEFFIHRDLSPDTGIAGVLPRILFPCLVAILARSGNRVEDPKAFAGLDVEPADVAFHIFPALGIRAGPVCSAHDHDVFGNGRGGVKAHFPGDQIHILVVIKLEIDDAFIPKGGGRNAGLRIQSDQPIAGCDVEDSLFGAVSPVCKAAARKLPWSGGAAGALTFAMNPELLAGDRIECNDGAARPAGGINDTVCHKRRAFELSFGSRTQVIRLEPPRHFQLAEIVCIDLIERRVACISRISTVGPPLSGFRSRLRGDAGICQNKQTQDWNDLCHPSSEGAHRDSSYHGICRLVYLRPISAACWLAGPTMTPSLIMSTTLLGFIEFRKKILFALHAAKTLARAACILGSLSATAPVPVTPSDNAMSPGPHSAIAMPGIFKFSSAFSSAYLSSNFKPSSSSPSGLSGQVSAFWRYSCADIPQIRAAVS